MSPPPLLPFSGSYLLALGFNPLSCDGVLAGSDRHVRPRSTMTTTSEQHQAEMHWGCHTCSASQLWGEGCRAPPPRCCLHAPTIISASPLALQQCYAGGVPPSAAACCDRLGVVLGLGLGVRLDEIHAPSAPMCLTWRLRPHSNSPHNSKHHDDSRNAFLCKVYMVLYMYRYT